ncbi:hypothetical protein GPECTOR_28g765 [Gonium pectorale]|uniref:Cyclic nucleotide-binding domain-containing protein n=1 Tax=Gonium pectorale TaxID=33097 RepID=A0A150GEW3_GONPE|nr:hypothetical protein GPECTOR_28g765 [Gonium pectorale]|eukprot:KXZ48358.1 hypothetical protein GPECTOR_28g765 [Gonium pectorale]
MDADNEKALVGLRAKSVKFADADDQPLAKRLGSGSNLSAKDSFKSVRSTRTNTSTWLNPSSRNRGKRRWRRFVMRLNPRYWVHVLNKRLPILLPETRKRRYWDFFVLSLVVWTALIVPFEVGFGSIQWSGSYAMARIVDACFWVDIALNFRTAFIDHSANMVRDGGKIASHYLRTWFFVDLTASVPFDVIVLWFVTNISNEGLIALGLLRTPRLLRLGRLLRYFDRMKGANIVRMGKLLFFMALVAHWVSCLWFMLYRLTHGTLVWSYDLLSNAKIMTFYLEAYLQSFLLMIGNDIGPQNNIERLYCTGILVIGACFYAIVVGHMSLLVNNMNPTASRHKFKKDIINNTVRYLGAPRDIAGRIDQYFDYLTTYSHPGPDGMALISQLPSSMFQDIAIWMYRDLVTKVPLFKECEPAFIAQLVIRLRLAVFLPSEVIFRIGDVGHEMYFITKGHVAVLNDNGEMLAILHKGGFFGELALLATARRTAQCDGTGTAAGGAVAGGRATADGAGGAAGPESGGVGVGTSADPGSDLSASTLALVEQVQATISRLTGKIEALQGKMGKIHTRLGRVEANPNIFNTGPPMAGMAGDPGGAGKNIFDVDFAGGM